MTFIKKAVVSTLAISMITASLGVLPLSQSGLAEKLGYIQSLSAAEAEAALPSDLFLEQMKELYAALAEGDPKDLQEVRNLRDEIAGLDEASSQYLIDPIWNKISTKLPESVDQTEFKATLFQLIKAVGSFRYDADASDLEAIRTNHEYRAALKTIAAVGGNANINMEDFIVFMFGDGGSRKGIEGTVGSLLAEKSPQELIQLLGNKQGITAVLLEATEKLLGETDAYTFGSIFQNLGVTAEDIRATVLQFQQKLKYDEPAISAMTVAYIRSKAKADVTISNEGRMHTYNLNVFGIKIIPMVLQWSKVSGDANVKVMPMGTVTIPDDAESGTAVIQAKLINPYGGSAKVIFQQEVTLKPEEEVVTQFPDGPFLERLNKLHAALAAGDPADSQAVRQLADEITALQFASNQTLLDPIWNKLAAKLPTTSNQANLKTSLFDMVKTIGLLPYDPKAVSLDTIRENAEYKATLKEIGKAVGVKSLVIDDLFMFQFGDGSTIPGIEGTVQNQLAALSSTELMRTLGDKQAMGALRLKATEQIVVDTEAYKISAIFKNIGVTMKEITETGLNVQEQLKKDEPASSAMIIANMRVQATDTVIVSENGREHKYGLKIFGVDIPSLAIRFGKVSGNKDLKVETDGKVTLAKGVKSASATIQATFINPYGGVAKVIFEKEVTLTAVGGGDLFPAEKFLEKLNKLHAALLAGDASDARNVRNLHDEIAKLNFVKDHTLLDPVWSKIASKLPKSINQVELKKSIFQMIQEVSGMPYAPDADALEAIRTNVNYQATLKTIAEVSGVEELTMDDYLILLFGDGGDRLGIGGTVRETIEDMKSQELAQLLGNSDKMNNILMEAIGEIVSEEEDYVFAEALQNLGVRSSDMRSAVQKFQQKLRYDEAATNALTVALIRSEVISAVKVSKTGIQHDYSLKLFGTTLSSSNLKWKKVSGSKDVTVDSKGKVTIPKTVDTGTAVIQASLSSNYGGSGKVIFEQEITLVNSEVELDPKKEFKRIADELDTNLNEIKKKLKAAVDAEQKAMLIVEVVQARNLAIKQINVVKTTNSLKNRAINETKSKANRVLTTIIMEIMRS